MSSFHDLERQEIDPEGRYRVEGLTVVERHALRLLPHLEMRYLMERTRDVFQFIAVHPHDPDVVVTPEFLELRLPKIEWPHPNLPARSSRSWKRVDWQGINDADLPGLLDEARQARRDEYGPCRFCGRLLPPEHLTAGACDDCAVRHMGIVH
jgi:hypothetical protein